MLHPKSIGKYLKTDQNGYIVPDVDQNHITKEWRSLVDFASTRLIDITGISSVYIRGSIPRGLAQENYSDADFLCCSTNDDINISSTLKEIRHISQEKFPFCRGLDIAILSPTSLNRIYPYQTRPYMHMLLKTQSLHLEGKNITEDLASFKPGRNTMSHIFNLKQDFEKCLNWHKTEPENIKSDREWFSRRLIRSGLEITLNRQNQYTRDLYLCYEMFSKHYPEHEKTMYQALENALNGHLDIKTFKNLISFLYNEYRAIFL